ncbi:MAG: RepB family plasmid replication initiator protein [Hymenobacter sp.]|jgi:hypothetical protein|nr:MAG: RepB family plasmid replication initiator protein [Hymenobacter sp.]
MTLESTTVARPLVVQHNALVNARLDLNTTEARLFLALLARIQRNDTSFAMCQLSVRELMDSAGSNNYDHLRRTLKGFASRTLTIEKLGPEGRPTKDRKLIVIPLLAYAEYREGEGLIEAQFNEHLRNYLLELRDNFTKAQLTELLKLKSASSYRIYWLLREYAAFGKRTIKVAELKNILGLSTEYDRFNNFRVKVLDRAQLELAETDLPFTYELLKQGRVVTDIRFHFPPQGQVALPALAAPTAAWEAALLAVGVSTVSLTAIRTRLEAGDYDEGYIHFVLQQVKSQVATGKVKKEAGAVFKALTDCYLLPAYQKAQQAAITKPKSKLIATQASRRKKLLSELEDAQNSLQFFQTSVLYTDETREPLVQQVNTRISELQQQLQHLEA